MTIGNCENDNELKRIGQLLRHDENIGVFNKFLICFVVLHAQALKTLSHEFWQFTLENVNSLYIFAD